MQSNLEIDRALALAIGWRADHMSIRDGCLAVRVDYPGATYWWAFDHLAPTVIWPIAERFGCFPFRCGNGFWCCSIILGELYTAEADNPATAVALAVIEAHK